MKIESENIVVHLKMGEAFFTKINFIEVTKKYIKVINLSNVFFVR